MWWTPTSQTTCNVFSVLSSSALMLYSQIVCAMPSVYCQVVLSCCTHKMYVDVQNPVVTLAWLFGYYQLLAPLISLSIDTKSFCQSPLRCKPVLIICLVYTFWVYFTILVRTEQFVNPLNFYNFSQSFRLQFAGMTIGGVVFYTIFVNMFRRVMNRYEHRRLSPL